MKGVLGLKKYMKFRIGHRGTSSPLVYLCPLSLSRINCQGPTGHSKNIADYLRRYP